MSVIKSSQWKNLANPALNFIVLIGVANLFADLTYEGGGSINGQFLGELGATAAAISIIAGLGEFLGYSIRALAGYVSDKTKKPWLIVFIGYSINLLSVPAMAFMSHWQLAAVLVFTERIGRAIRKPPVDAMISYTTKKVGVGWAYAVNTALDETGATLGPLLMTVVLLSHGSYRIGYAILIVPSILTLVVLSIAYKRYPLPARLEQHHETATRSFKKAYWTYMVGGAFFAAGLMSYELVAFHLAKTSIFDVKWIPLVLALATGFGVIATLILGKYFDRFGLKMVIVAVVMSSLFSPLVFFGGWFLVLLGMLCLGIGYSIQDALLKSVIAGVLPEGKRSLAFGLFYTGYGVGWLVGSIVMGMLYEYSFLVLVCFVMLCQLASLPFLIWGQRSLI